MTTLPLSLSELLGILGGVLGFFLSVVWVFGKVIVWQFKNRLDEKFQDQDEARETGSKTLRESIDRYTAEGRRTAEELGRVEREFLRWQAEMPKEYVRREDYIRNQTIIEAKQDGLYAETKLVQAQLRELIGRLEGERS